jgi:tetratricopeptide (TPR) repeat protein
MKKLLIIILFFSFLIYINPQDASNDNTKKTDNTNNQTVRIKNGWDYYNDGKYFESIKALSEEKKNYPDRINIYVILAWDYGNLKDYDSMEKVSQEGLNVSPDDIRILKNMIEACFYQNKFNQVIPHLEKYIALRYNNNDPYISTVYYYLGSSFLNLGYYKKADISLNTSLHFNPNDINTLLQLAETMTKLNQIDKSKSYYNSVLKIQPNNLQALDGLKKLENIQK